MKLEKIRTITGRIQVVTGLHIGASNDSIEIGGLDQPIIKDPLPGSKAPYIPGSSLKGKLRSLIEIKEGRYVKDGKNKGKPCDCGKKECPVCVVFGSSAAKRPEDLGPTRILVRDAHLSRHKDDEAVKSWHEKFNAGELPMEIKYENTIDRITGTAKDPRPLERVPGGVEFDFNISFKKFEGDEDVFFNTVLKGMKLLELDALGGAGSRGCGQIKFIEVSIDNEKQDETFLDSVAMN
ncbi:MAG: type III-A CRISPR-associated RAMP protein Csm3 [Deltaproteobacteria bacterium]|jgi:CRISPR-associated protein Csm3|nr:type III-A CRISPR-associated RAMP protein Csm3 [Deltaproteobacteria bacterium]MDL1987972.1 type III-A CRISPR-associated RAMP protein Csm3 [Deltaproteobacteria bacterium]